MKHHQEIVCPHCSSSDLQKNGHSENGTQRWRCLYCRKSFQLIYRYNARKPGVKEQIIVQTLNSSGVRDISRNLGINKNTVVSELKKTPHVNPYVLDMIEHGQLKKLEVDIYYTSEMDEFWSFVEKKSNQRWTWYAIDKSSGIILAWYNGKRTDTDFRQLLRYLENIPIDLYSSDDWGVHMREICLQSS